MTHTRFLHAIKWLRVARLAAVATLLAACQQHPAKAEVPQDVTDAPLMTTPEWIAKSPYTCSPKDSARVVALLAKAHRLKEKPQSWFLWMARLFVGTPYIGGTLDRDSEERVVVNLDELDCTTFVEQALALAICAQQGQQEFSSFVETLAHVRYIGGDVSYVKRQHYFTEWIADNVSEGLITDLQGPNPPFTAVQQPAVDYMTTHTSSYKMLAKHPEWLSGIKQLEHKVNAKAVRYITKERFANDKALKGVICDGDILAIITRKKGLDTTHIGIATWGKDGHLHLLNASSIHKKVIEEPMTLYQYMTRHPSQIGIRVSRMAATAGDKL